MTSSFGVCGADIAACWRMVLESASELVLARATLEQEMATDVSIKSGPGKQENLQKRRARNPKADWERDGFENPKNNKNKESKSADTHGKWDYNPRD